MNTGGSNVTAVSAYLTFDSSRLQVVNLDNSGSALSIEAENTVSGNQIRITRGQAAPGVSGSSVQVSRINFRAVSGGTANVSFTLNGVGQGPSRIVAAGNEGADILRSVVDASYSIGGATPIPTPTPTRTPTPTMTPYPTRTPVPTPTPAPYLTNCKELKFRLGDRIQSRYSMSVRTGPGYKYERLGVNPKGTQGVIVDVGRSDFGYYCYVKVDYDTGFDGWSAEYYLEKIEGGAALTAEQKQAIIEVLNRQLQLLQNLLDKILAQMQ
jgi:hypothetical protein